ncbi:WD repeat-containing protein 44 [Zea mays]|uniref:WD repeat-containing protein 44 n=1 Tax=Zea mays TaxID=4577 RepID=A0A3L6EWE0_MAIZE|nr:WD repeat-containing protein 44 [Zea mays]
MNVDEEVESGEEEEEDLFYESLDRILSSSGSSTSASDDDGADSPRRRRGCDAPVAAAAAALDLWTSQPSPVQERRRRLLQLMGLIGDPSLAGFETGRSASEDAAGPPPASPVCRSRSGGAALGSAGKPPLGGVRLRSSLSDGPDPADEDPRCLIRNLDDGREYVVKEEFGLREVGTGRHLTVEELARSPIVQELMRRQAFSTPNSNCNSNSQSGASTPIERSSSGSSNGGSRSKRRSSWLRSIRCAAGSLVTHSRDRSSSDEKDTSSEKGGHHSSSATDDSQDSVPRHGPARVKVRQYGKSYKELSGLFMTQEIHAHNGSIWSIKFSPDGRYLASAGEDCIIHVWEVLEFKRAGKEREVKENGVYNPLVAMVYSESSETMVASGAPSGSHWEKKLRSKVLHGGGSVSSDRLMVPEYVFALSEKPVITFAGHSEDVLDLSWSKSQYLLSSSMDKTVRLWHMSSTYCLKTFSHTDYVTCIQFNPVDDRYFISGSLDEKVRIWSIPKREIVDWVDLHEMVTAACYTPDGKGALIGSHKGSCHLYDTSDDMLCYKTQIDLQNKRRKSSQKKITGFQFVPGDSSMVIITSADSRIRVLDGFELVHRFKGFRNTSSQISACLAGNGRYIISASEDSRVYIWRNDDGSKPSKKKGIVSVTNTHEHFHCESVTVAVTWPFTSTTMTSLMNPRKQELERGSENGYSPQDLQTKLAKAQEMTDVEYRRTNITSYNSKHNSDRTSPAWPEELVTPPNQSLSATTCHANEGDQALNRSAWGLVIVTAGRGGQIRTFQNFGFPVRV